MCRKLALILMTAGLMPWAAAAMAQQFVTPGTVAPGTQPMRVQTLPPGGVPALRVGPDGAVHLDGPGAQPMRPTYTTQQNVVRQPLMSTYGGGFSDWLYNDPVPWQYNHRSALFGDFTYLRPRNAEVAYALPIEGTVALGDEVPVGPVGLVDQEYEPGFRVGGIWCLTDGASIRGQYSYFRSETSDNVTIVAPNVLRSLVMHPNTANAASDFDSASATQEINYDLVDIDYRGLIIGCESCCGNKCAIMVNGVIGGRYAMFDQGFRSTFVDGITTERVDTNIDFQGGGIRLGIEAEHHATETGLFVYGNGTTNLMVGEFEASYRQIHSVDGQEAFASWTAGRVVPTLDLELGVGWVGPRRRLKFSGGYLVSTWFNVVTNEEWINAVRANNFDDMNGVMTFDGLVARAQFDF